MRSQSVVVLWHYTIIIVTPGLKTDFSYTKTLIFDYFFIGFNAIDSPDIAFSSKQPNPNVTFEFALFQFHYTLYIVTRNNIVWKYGP